MYFSVIIIIISVLGVLIVWRTGFVFPFEIRTDTNGVRTGSLVVSSPWRTANGLRSLSGEREIQK